MRVTEDHGLYIANQAARVMRAVYNRQRKLDPHGLPRHNPCSAVEYNEEERAQISFAFSDFRSWLSKWNKIKSPSRKAFQMVGLLSGIRPGELSRLKWPDLFPVHPETGKPMRRTFLIRDAKAKNNIYVPFSAATARQLKQARMPATAANGCFRAEPKDHTSRASTMTACQHTARCTATSAHRRRGLRN